MMENTPLKQRFKNFLDLSEAAKTFGKEAFGSQSCNDQDTGNSDRDLVFCSFFSDIYIIPTKKIYMLTFRSIYVSGPPLTQNTLNTFYSELTSKKNP